MKHEKDLSKIATSAIASRAAIRAGHITGLTSGLSLGAMQANLVILPKSQADIFARFCNLNPRPCPLLARSSQGKPQLPSLGVDIDVRYDLPGYRIWRDGKVAQAVFDISEFWTSDMVAFALGCSFGFEAALVEAGISLRHIEKGCNVAMFDSNIPLKPSGSFKGNMVVSMRPIPKNRVEDVYRICKEFPLCHGAPVHVGDPKAIGITNIDSPHYGESVSIDADEIPVFWACGVTPQNVIRASKQPFAITHAPGKMLICDIPTGIRTLNI